MSFEKIIVNYDELKGIAQNFGYEAEFIDRVHQELIQKHDQLISTGWKGRGSETYKQEMENKIMPSLTRLSNALRAAREKTHQIMHTYREAETEASQLFTSGNEINFG